MDSHEIRTWPRSEDSPAQLDLHAWHIRSAANTNTRAVNKVAAHAIKDEPIALGQCRTVGLDRIDDVAVVQIEIPRARVRKTPVREPERRIGLHRALVRLRRTLPPAFEERMLALEECLQRRQGTGRHAA